MLGLPSPTERKILQMFPDQPLEDFDFEEPTLLQCLTVKESPAETNGLFALTTGFSQPLCI